MHTRRDSRRTVAAVCALAVACTLGALVAPVGTTPSWAQAAVSRVATGSPDDAGLAQLRADLSESSEAMLTAATRLRQARHDLPGARAASASARRQLAEARSTEERTARQQGIAQTAVMLASQSTDQSAALVADQRARLGRVARAAYQRGGPIGDISMLLEATSPSDFTERLVFLESIATSQRAALDDVRATASRIEGEASGLERQRDRLARVHERAQAQAETVAELTARSVEAEHDVRRLVAGRQAALADAEAARAEDERRLREQTAVSTQLQTQLAQTAQGVLGSAGTRAGASFPVRLGVLTWPVVAPITSPYGIRVHPITGVRKLHTGTDLGAPCGTQIYVARAGVVVSAGFNRAYGWRTVVSHGVLGGALLTTTYNHQQGLGVVVGQQLEAGQAIGTVGTTGYSTGCHLHVELIVNSDFVDPAPWLSGG